MLVIAISFFGCQRDVYVSKICEQEKAFISLDKFVRIQFFGADSDNVAPIEVGQPIPFDLFNSFKNVDTLIAEECKCKRKGHVCNGVIPLKYPYQNDTILIPAFHFSRQCMVDYHFHNRLELIIDTSGTYFLFNNSKLKVDDPKSKDSISILFDKSIGSFFKSVMEVMEKVENDTVVNRKINELPWNFNWLISIEIKDDKDIKRMKDPLDVLLSAYLFSLRKSVLNIYQKQICDLSPDEVRLFSRYLFPHYEIRKLVRYNE